MAGRKIMMQKTQKGRTMQANGIMKVNHAAASVLGLLIEGGEGCSTNNMTENKASA